MSSRTIFTLLTLAFLVAPATSAPPAAPGDAVPGDSDARPSAERSTPDAATVVERPVVVELFTSQGCSSCPPADEVLRRLGAEDDFIALSFHVDYWNRLGWRDPFSDRAWSSRQATYARAFGTDRSYTPMAVIDGRLDLIGSWEGELREAAAERRLVAPDAHVEVEAELFGNSIEAAIRVADADDLPRDVETVIVTYERRLTTQVKTGENARRTLEHDFVVRALKTAAGAPPRRQVRLAVRDDWERDQIGVAVLLQSRRGRQIFAAARSDAGH